MQLLLDGQCLLCQRLGFPESSGLPPEQNGKVAQRPGQAGTVACVQSRRQLDLP